VKQAVIIRRKISKLLRMSLLRMGKVINNLHYYHNFNLQKKINSEPNEEEFSYKTANTIMAFYQKVPPFYSEDIPEPLKIGGAWREDLQQRRKHQLRIIENKDVEGYRNLLNNMFKNNTCSGMDVPFNIDNKYDYLTQFYQNLDGFLYLTGKTKKELVSPNIGSKWGINVSGNTIKITEPNQGLKVNSIINLLNFCSINKDNYTILVELGGGYGGDMEKLLRFYKKPLKIIMVDIPLNLTTAFAYLSTIFPKYNSTLVTSTDEALNLLEFNDNETELIFIPTLIVDTLKKLDIDIVHNHGSFSEMDMITIDYYLKVLVTEKTSFLIETNSNKKVMNTDGHIEIPSSEFPIPKSHILLSRSPTWRTSLGHRYLESIYINVLKFRIP